MPGPYALVGSGTQLLGPVSALSVAITAKPAVVDQGNAVPTNWYHLGQLRVGSPYGYQPVRFLDANAVWVTCPTGTDRIGYQLASGVSVAITEVPLAAGPAAVTMPWDRFLASRIADYNGIVNPTGGFVTLWTFTVPAGRKLWMSGAHAAISRNTLHTALGFTIVQVSVDAAPIIDLAFVGGTVGSNDKADAAGGGMVVGAGSVVAARWISTDTGGSLWVSASVNGFEYSA